MGARRKLAEKIRKKQQEIRELEASLRDERKYLEGLEDSFKLLPRNDEDDEDADSTEAHGIRPSSLVGKALDALRTKGGPLHVNELLQAIGEVVTKEKRGALSGSLSAYVRRREIFSRPQPNTFGLLEWDRASEETEPPEDFGS